MTSRPLRVAALVKLIPKFEEMTLGPDGRLVREGLPLDMNAYCRRAVSQGTTLAAGTGGELTVISLGPPAAEDILREALAWADEHGAAARAVLVTDPAFAGSDTLATARALAAALTREGPFDVVLAGRNSVDADTGQVGPEVAELLDLPIVAGVRELDIDGDRAHVRCEYDDGWVTASVALPAVLTCAERLCEPCKVDPDGRAAVAPDRIGRVSAADLGPGPWGQAGSPTRVGEVRTVATDRRQRVLTGPLESQVAEAVAILDDLGALAPPDGGADERAPVPGPAGREGGPVVAVLVEPDRAGVTAELLGSAADLAAELQGRVVALAPAAAVADPSALGPQGADEVVVLAGSDVEEDLAAAVSGWAAGVTPWAIVAPSTVWGREVASRVAARLGAGLTGDAVGLDVEGGRLTAWKPAFGGALVAAITATSDVQMATVRAGVLAARRPRPEWAGGPAVSRLDVPARGRVEVKERTRDDDVDVLANAEVVIGLGQGIPPERYAELEPLRSVLGAELGATRKVTDKGWMPRARQIGITGRSIAPRLFVSLATSGKFNHMVGVRSAGFVLAVNSDPGALVFAASDLGIVGPWEDAVPLLAAEIGARVQG